ncbi:MAG: hypothetical protein NW241_21580 [Bacteroidia bacterium]|nr:hypothetical protein [Bacteroidia bacterium]
MKPSIRQEYSGHTGSVFATAVDPDERNLYSAGDDGIAVRWDLGAADPEGTGILRTGRSIYCLEYIPGLHLLAAGSSDGTVYLADLASRSIAHTYRKTESAIYGLHYEAGRQLLWVLHAHGAISALSLPGGGETGYLRIAQGHLRCAVPGPEPLSLLIGASDHQILHFDAGAGQVRHQFTAHSSSVFSLLLLPDGRLLSGGRDAYLRAWDTRDGYRLLAELPAHTFTVNGIALSPDARYVATAGRDKTLKIWDSATLALRKVIDAPRHQGHRHSVNRVHWLRDGSLISCSDDRRIIRWDLDFGE